MISPGELLAIKARLLTAADAAYRIATAAGPTVRYEQEEYEAAYVALLSMKEDVTAVLAELDVLRGVVAGGVEVFLKEEESRNEGAAEPGADVAAVSDATAGGGGEGEPSQCQGAGGGVPESGLPGKRTKRSKPRRNRKGNGDVPQPVGSGNGEKQMDCGTNP